MKNSLAQCLVLAIGGTMAQGASGTEPANSINFGLGGLNAMPHCKARVYTLEYEHRFTPTIAILGRGSGVFYTSDDDDYLEDGRLRGVDVGVRYYQAGQLQGFYTGGSLGYWQGDWTFTQHRGTPSQWDGEADSDSLRVNVDLGYRIPLRNTNVSIMPEINLGKFFSSSACEYIAPASQIGAPCHVKSVVDAYIFAGVTIGVTF